jgi:hypothetical protein
MTMNFGEFMVEHTQEISQQITQNTKRPGLPISARTPHGPPDPGELGGPPWAEEKAGLVPRQSIGRGGSHSGHRVLWPASDGSILALITD